eukprot:COSAG02_NODE_487_length_21276_cov_36.093167_9_plen_176_part_00
MHHVVTLTGAGRPARHRSKLPSRPTRPLVDPFPLPNRHRRTESNRGYLARAHPFTSSLQPAYTPAYSIWASSTQRFTTLARPHHCFIPTPPPAPPPLPASLSYTLICPNVRSRDPPAGRRDRPSSHRRSACQPTTRLLHGPAGSYRSFEPNGASNPGHLLPNCAYCARLGVSTFH